MIALLLFYLHIVAFTAAFTHQYQEEDIKAGVLTMAFMGIIFSVGWSISTFLLKMVIAEKGLGIWLTRDSMGLVLLTLGEAGFYYLYFRGIQVKR
ncbi:MAG: hypothetical protein NTV54_02115 [Ignavibacteriales bacterium]|nr:hypothetical protein [Ignavibacteriales bacterium]